MSGLSIPVLKKEVQNGCELEPLLDKTKSPVGERSLTALLASEVPGAGRVPEGPASAGAASSTGFAYYY